MTWIILAAVLALLAASYLGWLPPGVERPGDLRPTRR